MALRKLKTIAALPEYRTPFIGRDMIDEEKRTVTLSFSSEAPVDRWYGKEILDHSKSSIRLDRFRNGANLLLDHDPSKVIGVIENVAIDTESKKASVTVRFSKSEEGQKVWEDVLDGIRLNVSVGYRVHKMVLEESDEKAGDTYRAMDWEPFEVSMVGVPADATVGVGRDLPGDNKITIYEREEDMKKCNLCGKDHESVDARGYCPTCVEAVRAAAAVTPAPAAPAAPAADVRSLDEEFEAKMKDEAERTDAIRAMGDEHNMSELAEKCVRERTSVPDTMALILKEMGATPVVQKPGLGMSGNELKRYSVMKAIRACSPSEFPKEDFGYERELSAEVEKTHKIKARGVIIPYDVLTEQRDLNVTTDAQGGYTVATELLSMIEKLENSTMVAQLGAMMMGGLVGDIAIPRQTAGATAFWLSDETTAVTESTPTFDQLALTPKTIGALTEYTRNFLLQSSIDAENFVRGDIALRLALGVDLAAINGSGAAGQPTGILNTSGIGDVSLGADGGPMTWLDFIQLWTEVAQDNAAFGSTGFLTNSKVHGHLMGIEKAANTGRFIAENFVDATGMTVYAGARGAVSNQVPSNLEQGASGAILSAMIFGNWADLIIALWGGLDILTNPFSKQTTRIIGVTGFQSIDIKTRHAQSFAASQNIDTTN